MKKVFVLSCVLLLVFAMSACQIKTPAGTLHVGFDSEDKSEQTKIIDAAGNETVIDVNDLSSFLDKMLEGVALPQGTNTAELKSFVYETIGSLGIDVHDLANSDAVEAAIKEALESQGVDTSNMDINVEDWITQEKDTNETGN